MKKSNMSDRIDNLHNDKKNSLEESIKPLVQVDDIKCHNDISNNSFENGPWNDSYEGGFNDWSNSIVVGSREIINVFSK